MISRNPLSSIYNYFYNPGTLDDNSTISVFQQSYYSNNVLQVTNQSFLDTWAFISTVLDSDTQFVR